MNIANSVSYLFKDSLALISLIYIFRYIFSEKIKLKNAGFISCLVLITANAFVGVFVLFSKMDDADSLMDFVSNILYIAALYFATEKVKLSKIIWIVMVYIFTVDMFYSLYSSYVGGQLYIECLLNCLMFLAVCILIKYVVRGASINFLPKMFSEIPKWVFLTLLLFDLTCYYKEFGISENWYNILYIFSSSTVILCVLYLVAKIFFMAHRQNEIVAMVNTQKEYTESLLTSDTEIRKFRHDYKNHMIVINALLESGKIEEARKYLVSINDRISGVVNRISSGNFVADAILNNKAVSCGCKDIIIKLSGKIPEGCIKNEDLCTILANAIDNAIEACEKIEGEKTINVESIVKNGYLILSISNPAQNVTVKAGKLKTTKKDKRSHGFGLKNIERALENYDGNMNISCENNVFTLDIRTKIGT